MRETVNDADSVRRELWRRLQHASDDVARWCDWPVNEIADPARHPLASVNEGRAHRGNGSRSESSSDARGGG